MWDGLPDFARYLILSVGALIGLGLFLAYTVVAVWAGTAIGCAYAGYLWFGGLLGTLGGLVGGVVLGAIPAVVVDILRTKLVGED